MNKQGYLIGRSSSAKEYFTASSAYDRPQWVSLAEATVFPTAEMAQSAAKKLWQYGVYSASPVMVAEAMKALPSETIDDELDPSLEGLPPEDVDLLSQPADDESGYGADGETDVDGIDAMDGEVDPEADIDADDADIEISLDADPEDESGYGADGETDADGIDAIDGEGDPEAGGGFEFELPDDEDENDENAISSIELKMLKRPTMEAVDSNGDRVFQTYAAWKRAVKAIDPAAEFYGDKDIGGAKGIGEWDGETGLIFAKALRDKWASEKTNESVLMELSKTTLKSYLQRAVKSTKELVDKGDMVKGVSRAKKAAWASGKLKEKMFESADTKKIEYADPSVECNKGVGEYANKPGSDKVTVPASVKSALSAVVAKFKKTADAADGRDGVSASQDLTVADALQQLLDDLSAGTLDGIMQAQIHMTSYMTPITQHIPAEVVKFIAKGGKQDSLKDMFTSIKESKREDFDKMAQAWDDEMTREMTAPSYRVVIASTNAADKAVTIKGWDESEIRRKAKHHCAKLENPTVVSITKLR